MPSEDWWWGPQRSKILGFPCPTLGIHPKKLSQNLKEILALPFLTLFIISKIWKQLKCSLVDERKLRYDIQNPGLPHCSQILYCLIHQGSPTMEHYSVLKKETLSFSMIWLDLENIKWNKPELEIHILYDLTYMWFAMSWGRSERRDDGQNV